MNEEIYEARVLSSLNTEAAGEEAGDTAEYRVAIISGEDVIGEAVMHGRASIQYQAAGRCCAIIVQEAA